MSVMLVTDPNGSVGVDPKLAEPVKAMVRELLERAKITGAFRIRCGQHRKGTAHFRIRVCPQPSWPLMLIVRPFSNDSAWEWLISPTLPNMEFEPVQAAVRACLDGESEPEPEPEPEPEVVAEERKPGSKKAKAEALTPLQEKLERARALVSEFQQQQAAVTDLELELFEAMERAKLLEDKVKAAQAAVDANTVGKVAAAFLHNYEALIQADLG